MVAPGHTFHSHKLRRAGGRIKLCFLKGKSNDGQDNHRNSSIRHYIAGFLRREKIGRSGGEEGGDNRGDYSDCHRAAYITGTPAVKCLDGLLLTKLLLTFN